MTSPIAIPTRLAGNPKHHPHFYMQIPRRGEDPLWVSDPRALRALVALMDMNAVLGGAACHYGGPAALAELISVQHALVFEQAKKMGKPWFELFHLVNDAGHCENIFYALKANYEMAGLSFESLKGFRSLQSKLTGHGESHLFPEGVLLSNGPLGSAFPQSQGLAMAEAAAGTMRTTVTILSDGASMEGEAKEAFSAIPGLARRGQMGPYVLILSDNNTKLTGRIDQDSFSMEPTFESLESLGWKVMGLANGHDLGACQQVLAEAFAMAQQNPKQPIFVHAKTIKGIGTKKTADSASGGHGFPLKSVKELPPFLSEIYSGDSYPALFSDWIQDLERTEAKIKNATVPDTGEKIQKGIAAAMMTARAQGLPVISVTSDLPGSTGVADFRKTYPQASFDVGVAESNMISAAAGMSKMGYIPVVDTFAQFGVTKGSLPLTMAALSEAPVIAVFSHTGFQDAADGASHQALSYFSMLASIPDVELYSLSCSSEAEALMSQALLRFASERQEGRTPPSMVFFLGRENFPAAYVQNPSYQLPRVFVERTSQKAPSKSVCLIVGGSLMPQAILAAGDLEKDGFGVCVVHASIMNRFDEKTLLPLVQSCGGRVVTAEDHQVALGLGSFLSHQLVLRREPLSLKSLGVHGEFGQSAYNAIELYHKHKIDRAAIVAAARSLFEN